MVSLVDEELSGEAFRRGRYNVRHRVLIGCVTFGFERSWKGQQLRQRIYCLSRPEANRSRMPLEVT